MGRAELVSLELTSDFLLRSALHNHYANPRYSNGPVSISHNCFHYSILAMKIEEFEKSELSIRLVDKMDKIERTWERFWESAIRIVFVFFNSKWTRALCSMVYYFLIAVSAFLLTRDSEEESFREMEVSQFQKNMVEAFIVFLFLCI